MGKSEYHKRNKLDIILTDSRPVEVLKNFTLAYFYEYLNGNSAMEKMCNIITTELIPSLKIASANKKFLINSDWHSIPLKYHIYKNNHELRQMSILNPLSLIELRLFIEAYEKELLYFANEEGFSVRKHFYNDSLRYVEKEGKGLVYVSDQDASKNIEASGDFYKIAPFKFLSDFHNSSLWYQLNREYRYCGKIDYSKCFDSVYTHTFSWLIAENLTDRKKYSRDTQYFLNACDTILQNMNGSVTNGISVGPEFSRLVVEILMQHVDNSIKKSLFNEGYVEKENYRICRFVDDIFVFADEEKLIEHIIDLYASNAEYFHFRLNDKKRRIDKLPTIWFEWKEAIRPVNDYIRQAIFRNNDQGDYIIKNFIRNGKGMVPIMKMMFQDTIASYSEHAAKITSYVLSTIYKKVKSRGKKKIIDERYMEGVLTHFLDSIFYFYSFGATYNNTEKIIGILFELSDEIPEEIFRDVLQEIVNKYEFIFTKSNLEDFVNLILVFHFLNIQLPYSSELSFVNKVREEKNPILYALLFLYSQYESDFRRAVMDEIYEHIITAMENIHYERRFFEYKECWWFYIFCDCPYINKLMNKQMKAKLMRIREKIKADVKMGEYDICIDSKRILIDFLLDKKRKNKFFDWTYKKEALCAITEFKTYQRMILNGLKVNEEYIEEEDY